MTKLALSVFVAMWIHESGLGPPTHVRANSKPVASRAPPKALTSHARIGQVWLVTFHTRTSLTHWNPSPAGLASQTRTCMGSLTLNSKKCNYGVDVQQLFTNCKFQLCSFAFISSFANHGILVVCSCSVKVQQ